MKTSRINDKLSLYDYKDKMSYIGDNAESEILVCNSHSPKSLSIINSILNSKKRCINFGKYVKNISFTDAYNSYKNRGIKYRRSKLHDYGVQ
jgi:hypothetical protein